MSSYQAQKQFEENLNLFGNPKTQPEKFNLYAGLLNLAKAVRQIESEISSLKDELRRTR